MIRSKLDFPIAGEIRLGGYGGRMIDYTVERQLMDTDTWALLVEQFRRQEDSDNGGWRGEYWGKMMRGAALTYRATKNEKLYSVLAATVKDMLSTQEKNGRFSSYTTKREFVCWDMWGRKYVMLGMMYFLDICKSRELKKKIISALKKHADYIIKHVGEGRGKIGIIDTSNRIGSMNSCSILEPFVKLYGLTGEKRYFDFATYLVNTGLCKDADLIDLALKKELYPYQYPQVKAYEMMSCFEGVLEYYKYTEDPKYLTAVENFVEMLIKSDYTLIGCSGCKHEYLDNSTLTQTEPATDVVMQETCVTVTFIKLCAKLLAVTGNPKYAEYIERSGLNAMYGAVNNEDQTMRRTIVRTWNAKGEVVYIDDHGSFPFDSYSPLYMDRRGIRCGGMQFIGEGRCYGCCICIGSAGTAIMGLFPVMKAEGGLYVNLYNDCRFTADVSGEKIRLDMRADPYDPKGAKITVDGKGVEFALYLRIPSWAEGFSVTVNGTETETVNDGGYVVINRSWGKDKVEVRFRAPVKMQVIGGKIAFTKGPITLARDSRFGDISTPLTISAKDGRTVRARRVKNTVFSSNTAYEVDTAAGTITLCDYAQAGKNFDDEDSIVTVWQDKKQ